LRRYAPHPPEQEGPGFGDLLRELRTCVDLTQEELAEKSGLGLRTISDLERGVSRPRPTSIRLLAGALGLNDAQTANFRLIARGRLPGSAWTTGSIA
jgi:transcriptional regulator with XRE-family HTH domain